MLKLWNNIFSASTKAKEEEREEREWVVIKSSQRHTSFSCLWMFKLEVIQLEMFLFYYALAIFKMKQIFCLSVIFIWILCSYCMNNEEKCLKLYENLCFEDLVENWTTIFKLYRQSDDVFFFCLIWYLYGLVLVHLIFYNIFKYTVYSYLSPLISLFPESQNLK